MSTRYSVEVISMAAGTRGKRAHRYEIWKGDRRIAQPKLWYPTLRGCYAAAAKDIAALNAKEAA